MKTNRTKRIGIFFSHPTQHHSVMFKYLSQLSDLKTKIYYYDYGSLRGAYDPGYGTSEGWDVDLLTGTPSHVLPNWLRGKAGRPVSQFRQLNPHIIGAMLRGRFDAVFVSGYVSPSNWMVLLMAKLTGARVLYQSDSNILDEQRKPQSRLKNVLRRLFLNQVDTFLPIGNKNRDLYSSLGYDSSAMVWCPCPVDVERFQAFCQRPETGAQCAELRCKYGIPEDAKVVAFCGKLIERKRPLDLIEAIKLLDREDVYALLIGSGPLEAELRAGLAPNDPVRITGFVNQMLMPAHMMLADMGVICSEWDPHPLVATEFAACALPVVSSHFCGLWGDHDILRPEENGFIYQCGDIEQLAAHIEKLVDDEDLCCRMGARSLELSATQSAKYGAQVIARHLNSSRVDNASDPAT
jgi:glycosyltransferase involved in cell wall biosynthesis